MGLVYREIERFIPDTIDGDHVFVEIGSDRGEGSTEYLDDLAGRYHTQLVTVDVNVRASQRLAASCGHTQFVIASGSDWSRGFAQSQHRISVLYLDNFDYIWDVHRVTPAQRQQIFRYESVGIRMNNQNCQVEHLQQMINLAPVLHPQATVVFDDTYCVNDCWIGKCGPAVVYMKTQGWQVVWHQNHGVIMQRR
jgi:hypothetical protein